MSLRQENSDVDSEETPLKSIPLWRRILDKLSGIWLIVDGFGTLLMIGTALYLAIHLGIWSVGIGVLLFEVIGMLNSFYVGHQMVRL